MRSTTAAATATAAFGTDQGDAAANADASSNLVKGSREFAETNKAISATEAKDDGGGEEERTILQDALSTSDEHLVRLTDAANLLLDKDSDESELLEALEDLHSVLSFGHENNNDQYATFVYEFKGLIERLEQMQLYVSDEVRTKIVDIFEDYFQGAEEEVNETESTETSLGHDAVDYDATQAQDDNKGRRPELELQEAEVWVKKEEKWKYCLGSYTCENSSGELESHNILGALSISDKTLTVRNISNRAILFCAKVCVGFGYQQGKKGRPIICAKEKDSEPKTYMLDVAENDRNDLRVALRALMEG